MRILACLALALALAVPLRADEPPPTEHRTIRVKPTATLSVNHVPEGRSDLFQIDLPTGKPALLRVSEPGYVTQWRTITPSPNDSSTIEITLERAPIPVLFRGEVPAVVLCDGAERGTVPCHLFFNEPRAYRITFRAEGFLERTLRLDLSDGKPKVVDAALTSSTATLDLASEPAGATVLLDGVPQGQTPLTLRKIRPGKHEVTFSHNGYRTLTHTLTLDAGQEATLSMPLERLPAGLTVTTLPIGARVYVDGVFRGESDLTLKDLPAGTHTIRVERYGYAQAERTVTVGAGESRAEEFRLSIIRGTLAVQTQPGAVEVWEGEERLLTTKPGKDGYTSQLATVQLPPGKHTLTLKAYGYADLTKTVDITAAQTLTLREKLTFKPNLTLTTKDGKTYSGVLVKYGGDGTVSLELKPGMTRTFTPAEAPTYDKEALQRALEAWGAQH